MVWVVASCLPHTLEGICMKNNESPMDYTIQLNDTFVATWMNVMQGEKVKQRLLLDKLQHSLEEEVAIWVHDKKPNTAMEAADLTLQFCLERKREWSRIY